MEILQELEEKSVQVSKEAMSSSNRKARQNQAKEDAALPLLRKFGQEALKLYPDQIKAVYLVKQKIPNPAGSCRLGLLYCDTQVDSFSDEECYNWVFQSFGAIPLNLPDSENKRYIFPQISVQAERWEELKQDPIFNDNYQILENLC